MTRRPDLYSVAPDGTKDDAWIFAELLGADDLPERGYAHTIDDPFETRDQPADHPLRTAEWDESQHPRNPDGTFGTSGGVAVSTHQIADDASATGRAHTQTMAAAETQIAKPSVHYPPANPHGADTESRFKTGGHYTPERQALHDAIVTKTIGAATPQPASQRVAIIKGGGPASGKSSIDAHIDLPHDAVTVDADLIRAHFPEYGDKLAANDPSAAAYTHEEASHVSKVASRTAAASGRNVILDGTGDSSIESLEKKVATLRSGGARVEAHYVTVPTDIAVDRANARAAQSGRHVPETYMRETHRNVSRVLPDAIRRGLFDTVTVWDNTHTTPVKIATAHGKTLEVHDQAKWDAFVAKGHEATVAKHGAARQAAAAEIVTSDELERMLVEILTGQPPTLHSATADALRAQLTAEVAAIAKAGGTVQIPPEVAL